MTPVQPPVIKGMIDREIAEHEVFLSFNGDNDARFFQLWWDRTGEKTFLKWANAGKRDIE